MIDLLRQRRSVRVFEDRPIEPNKVELLKEAVLRSPSSRNIDPWEFIFVDNREILKKLAAAKKSGSAFLAGAALGVVVCADEQACDVWIEDCSIASILVQLTAQSLGLASCWTQIRLRLHDETTASEQYVRRILEIPHILRVLSIIGIGYPAEFPEPIPAAELKLKKIHTNRW